MKKYIALLLAVVMLLGLVGCGAKKAEAEKDQLVNWILTLDEVEAI